MNEHAERLAPVLIGTCNRINHFKALVESLQSCYWAKETELYIAIDSPYADEVREVNHQIKSYSKAITGFAKVHIIDRPYNYGITENFNQAMDAIFQQYATLILLEDDNIVAKNFLVFMNKALRTFEHDPKCFAICGYNFTSEPIEEPHLTDIYTAPYQSGWGVGYWKVKYSHPDQNATERPDAFFLNLFNLIKSHYYSPHLFPMYVGSYLSGKVFGDTQISLHVLKRHLYCIYPRLTKVINKGNDGSGVHCGSGCDRYHSDFSSTDQKEFHLFINKKINYQHAELNRQWFNKIIKIKSHKRIYACIIYFTASALGRVRTIKIKDSIRNTIRIGKENASNYFKGNHA